MRFVCYPQLKLHARNGSAGGIMYVAFPGGLLPAGSATALAGPSERENPDQFFLSLLARCPALP